MPILVDTSVWSFTLRRKRPSLHSSMAILDSLLKGSEEVFVLDVIVQEILEGIRDEVFFEKIQKEMGNLPSLPVSRRTHVLAAHIFNLCRNHGIATTTIDCLIAAAAIEHNCRLFTLDRDFQRIAEYHPLKLLPYTD